MLYRCSNCDVLIVGDVVAGEVVDHDRPCPGCGGNKIALLEKPSGTGFAFVMKLKVPKGELPKVPIESRVTVGINQSGQWVRSMRTINRKDDHYTEEIVDQITGKVIHKCDEPLTMHRGHGSAKLR